MGVPPAATHPGAPLLLSQIGHAVLHSGRPEVPPPNELPGPDTAAFTGLDAYCDLMR